MMALLNKNSFVKKSVVLVVCSLLHSKSGTYGAVVAPAACPVHPAPHSRRGGICDVLRPSPDDAPHHPKATDYLQGASDPAKFPERIDVLRVYVGSPNEAPLNIEIPAQALMGFANSQTKTTLTLDAVRAKVVRALRDVIETAEGHKYELAVGSGSAFTLDLFAEDLLDGKRKVAEVVQNKDVIYENGGSLVVLPLLVTDVPTNDIALLKSQFSQGRSDPAHSFDLIMQKLFALFEFLLADRTDISGALNVLFPYISSHLEAQHAINAPVAGTSSHVAKANNPFIEVRTGNAIVPDFLKRFTHAIDYNYFVDRSYGGWMELAFPVTPTNGAIGSQHASKVDITLELLVNWISEQYLRARRTGQSVQDIEAAHWITETLGEGHPTDFLGKNADRLSYDVKALKERKLGKVKVEAYPQASIGALHIADPEYHKGFPAGGLVKISLFPANFNKASPDNKYFYSFVFRTREHRMSKHVERPQEKRQHPY
jgi:hypothetical protein